MIPPPHPSRRFLLEMQYDLDVSSECLIFFYFIFFPAAAVFTIAKVLQSMTSQKIRRGHCGVKDERCLL